MEPKPGRRGLLAGAGAAALTALAGCLGGLGGGSTENDGSGGEGGGAGNDGETTGTDGTAAAAAAGIPTTDVPLHVAHEFSRIRRRTVSGGPPKDGIPAIDDPRFESAEKADGRLSDGDVVFGVTVGDAVKAYPQQILVWHEICNDTVGGENLAVTYCPLTGTAMGFRRGETTFGVSGNLVNSNLVMYDRATDSRWPQVLATAVKGPFEGRSLQEVPVAWTTWGEWRAAHPDTQVLSEDTGYVRNYGSDPYGKYNPKRGYYADEKLLFGALADDDRLRRKKVVVGLRTDRGAAAVTREKLIAEGVVAVEIGETPHLLAFDAEEGTAYGYRNADGASFTATADGIEGPDGETHQARALPLPRVPAIEAMWFAWYGFYPGTSLDA